MLQQTKKPNISNSQWNFAADTSHTKYQKKHKLQNIIYLLQYILYIFIYLYISFKGHCFSIENHAWESNELKDGIIQLDILNKSFYNDTNIKKNQEIDYVFIMNQKCNEKIVTLYNKI